MKHLITFSLCLVVFLSSILSLHAFGQTKKGDKVPNTIEELRSAILNVLEETGIPAAGIALVDRNGPVWVEGLGMADLEKSVPADEETMFRIGSTSKIFAALAILKLQEQGKLSLKDRVKELIPEIEFTNPWEESQPILVEHLLEHTTGWDDLHPIEFTNYKSDKITLKEALELHPHSRVSKWVPGTRMAYANSGPSVAAYIVEKITGQPYEEFIQKNFFSPMGMETMTYFKSDDYVKNGATLYKEGYPQEYWHIMMRPSGGINASPKDMAKMLQFFINRGRANSNAILSAASLDRMETPSTTSGAKSGLKYGYGLGLYTSRHNVYTYYKHGGSIGGGSSDFSYLPECGVGYSVQINSGNSTAMRKIRKLIRDFQTQDLPAPQKLDVGLKAGTPALALAGYYQTINPILNFPFNIPSLLAERIWVEGDTLYKQNPAHVGQIVKFVPVGNGQYYNSETGRVDFFVVQDPLEGEVLELAGSEGGTVTLGSVSGVVVFSKLLVLILWILLMILTFLLVPFWAFRFWKGKLSGKANFQVRFWPVLTSLLVILSVILFMSGAMLSKDVLAKPSIISIPLLIASVLFLLAALYAVFTIVRFRKNGVKTSVYLLYGGLAGLHLLVAIYLLWHGVIGLRTWA